MNFSSLRSSLISLIRETFSYRKGGGESECRWTSDQQAQDLPWPVAEGVGKVRLGPGSRLHLWFLWYHESLFWLVDWSLEVSADSPSSGLWQCKIQTGSVFPSIQALPISSDNKAFHGLNALKFHSNPMHRFCYNHRMLRKPRQREVI